jgi:peptidoglycan/LPS O-acetylase OafA/YrhL
VKSNAQPNLDLVRATAVLCVFGGHLYIATTRDEQNLVAWRFAQMGVLMFFVHTACVLMWSLERSASKLSGLALYTDFYIRRAFRIYPLAMACVALSYFGFSLVRADWTPGQLLGNLTLTMNLFEVPAMWGGHWTLPIEVQMYVVLPMLFLGLRRRSWRFVMALWCVAVVMGVLQPTGRLNVLEYAPCFMAGVLAWHLSRTSARKWPAAWWPLVFLATWGIWLISDRNDARIWYRWAFCLSLGAAIPYFRDLTFTPLTKTTGWIAKYSYGIYLGHLTVFWFAFTFDSWVRWALLIVLSVLVPVAVFYLVEDPMIRLGQRVARYRAQRLMHAKEKSLSLSSAD